MGGSFSHVGGVPRRNLAHILADGGLDATFDPSPDREVTGLRATSSRLYVAGRFLNIGSVLQPHLAALSQPSGAVIASFAPDLSGTPAAITLGGGRVYAGGPHPADSPLGQGWLHAFMLTDGATDFAFDPGDIDGPVLGLAATPTTLYAAGDFTEIGGQLRARLAALDSNGDAQSGFNPGPNDTVKTLVLAGSTLYAGGEFTAIGGAARPRLAALSLPGGTVSPSFHPGLDGAVRSVAVAGSTIYLAGAFTAVGGQQRHGLAAVSSTGGVTPFDPHPNAQVHTLAAAAATLYAGGAFTSVGGVARRNLAAINPATGQATSFNPSPNGQIQVLAGNDSTPLYVSGAYSTIAGAPRGGVAAVRRDGVVTGFSANVGGIAAMALGGGRLYLGGEFSSANGHARRNLVRVDPTTGTLDMGWTPQPNKEVSALLATSSRLYVAGGFGGFFEGKAYLTTLDLPGGTLNTSFQPSPAGPVRALALAPGRLYIGGRFQAVTTVSRSRVAALNVSDGTVLASFVPPEITTGVEGAIPTRVTSLAANSSGVFLGGVFNRVGTEQRIGLAELTPTGALTAWDPGPRGGPDNVPPVVRLAADGTLYMGGAFKWLEAYPQQGFAAFGP